MNTPLLAVLPFCEKDTHLAKKLLEHIVGFGPMREPHSILIAADSRVKREVLLDFKALASSAFHFCEGVIITVPDDRQSWPKGPNFMFHNASQVAMERYKLPWLWLEPDAVPLRHDWLDQLAQEYAACPKRFMGTMATVALSPDLPQRHMSGVAVYPPDAYTIMKEACASDIAFDYASAAAVLGRHRAWETKLIYEIWGSHTEIPTFKAIRAPDDKSNILVPAVIPKEAVLYHRCKDDSLLNLLNGKPVSREEPKKSAAPEPIQEVLEKMAEEPARKTAKTRVGVPESKMAAI